VFGYHDDFNRFCVWSVTFVNAESLNSYTIFSQYFLTVYEKYILLAINDSGKHVTSFFI